MNNKEDNHQVLISFSEYEEFKKLNKDKEAYLNELGKGFKEAVVRSINVLFENIDYIYNRYNDSFADIPKRELKYYEKYNHAINFLKDGSDELKEGMIENVIDEYINIKIR